jgi:hypothetical protein
VTIKSITFWDVTLCSPADVQWRVEEHAKQQPRNMLVTSLAYSSWLQDGGIEPLLDYTEPHPRR